MFLFIFDEKNKSEALLSRFDRWRIDKTDLSNLFEKNKEVLLAEEIDLNKLITLMTHAEKLGFTRMKDNDKWELLEPVYRYLEYYKSAATDQVGSISTEALDTDVEVEFEEYDNELDDE